MEKIVPILFLATIINCAAMDKSKKLVLEYHKDLLVRKSSGSSCKKRYPYNKAIKSKNIPSNKLFMVHKDKIKNYKEQEKKNLFYEAVSEKDISLALFLLEDVFIEPRFLPCPQDKPEKLYIAMGNLLHIAIEKQNTNAIKALLEKRINPNYKVTTSDNQTPLIKAILQRDLQLVKLLVEKGADLNLKGKNNLYPLDYAQNIYEKEGTKNILEYLVKKEATKSSKK